MPGKHSPKTKAIEAKGGAALERYLYPAAIVTAILGLVLIF